MSFRAIFVVLVAIAAIFMVSSCSPMKHVPEGEVFYLGTNSLKYYSASEGSQQKRVKQKAEKSASIIKTLWVKPNGALLGMPFVRVFPLRLYFYNWFYTEEDSTFSHWMMENFGEPPRTISDVNPEARVQLIENELFNRGYFGVKGDYRLQYKKNGKKNKAWVHYSFVLPDGYTYRHVGVNLDSGQLVFQAPIDSYMEQSLILPGESFNLDEIAREKRSLWEHLQNEGFYHLKEEHILIIADSTAGTRQVDLEYRINMHSMDQIYEKVYIGDKHLELDTALKVKPRLLEKAIPIQTDSLYRLENTKKAIRNISSLGFIANPIVSYETEPGDSTQLKANVSLGSMDLFTFGATGKMTTKNTNYIGPDLGLFATQKNLFGGGENLTISVNGYMDFPFGVLSERVSRSSGFSVSASLSTPVIRTPLPIGKKSVGLPRRNISLSLELNNRQDFFEIVEWKTSYGLSWHRSSKINHSINLINLNYAYLIDSTRQFQDLIEQSPLIEYSYRSQIILGPSYTFTYNNTLDRTKRVTMYYRADIETAGNLLEGIYRLAGKNGKEKNFLGVPFSQYLRLYSDFRTYFQVGRHRNSQLVFRNVVGWGAAYGNSLSVPYTRQFFIGGSNSLRPITARVVGPGRYLEFNESAYNQVGDIKIENNLEFRFKIFYIFYGALWGDLGNIWLLHEDPKRPGSGIRLNRLLKDSYFTTGVGLRVDLDFLVLRADYGAILYVPFFTDNYRWIWQNKGDFYGLVFGIGYPF